VDLPDQLRPSGLASLYDGLDFGLSDLGTAGEDVHAKVRLSAERGDISMS